MNYQIPFLDLSVKNPVIKKELLESVSNVLTHGRLVLGPEVDMFEKLISEYCGVKYTVGVNSGTDALYLALRSLDIGPGDEVITTPLSWIATVNSIVLCGAKPVFVDITNDLTINNELIEAVISSKTKAILPVHFTGRLCDMHQISEIANRNSLYLIEDAAPAFGASYRGAKAGSFGNVSAFSMNPMKVFNGYGEAGAVVTNDTNIYERLMSLRYAGTINKEDCQEPSLNGRIDTVQAAMMLVGFKYLQNKIAKRREIASYYNNTLGDSVICPQEREGYFNVYYTYTIIADRRDDLQEHLTSKGIETKIQHPILMPYHTAYKNSNKIKIPVAENLVNRILCIPSHENLTNQDIRHVANTIREFYGKQKT